MIFGLVAAFGKDWEKIQADGFFQGYNASVVIVVLLQAVGGLVVASVLKYADNLLKCFAAALALVMSAFLSKAILSEGPDLTNYPFLLGCIAVMISTTLYSLGLDGLKGII